MAERVNLALPADANDIENVPWGQKATFNAAGHDENSEEHTSSSSSSGPTRRPVLSRQSSQGDQPRSVRPQFGRMRPGLESRHSYAGQGITTKDVGQLRPNVISRPTMPSRTVSHAPSLLRHDNSSAMMGFSTSTMDLRHTSMSDPDFSSIGGEQHILPHMAVFPVLKGLDYETDGLIDTGGINKVLERGKLIALTRDYAVEPNTSSDLPTATQSNTNFANAGKAPINDLRQSEAMSKMGNYRSVFSHLEVSSGQRRGSNFEEYEQTPASPWAQSPAPSPAMQSDPEHNPFFNSEDRESVEDSFDPTATPDDYSHLENIEAIGVDRAHTVIHIPLIHPTLSATMPDMHGDANDKSETPDSRQTPTNDQSTSDRRAPIAILSVLSPAVPFPQNLVHSLKLLGPHLAASYHMAHQLTAAQNQALGIRHRRGTSGRAVGFVPLEIEPANLDDLIRADLEEATGSMSGSITSPSDYSGRSKHSPSSSIAGTPGWDPSYSYNRSISGTPAAFLEGGEGYFDSRKRSSLHRSTSAAGSGNSTAVTPAKGGRKSNVPTEEEASASKRDRKLKAPSSARAEKSPLRAMAPRNQSPPRLSDTSSPQRPGYRSIPSQQDIMAENTDRRHSLLHSYGADFSSSFQSLPATTTAPKTPGSGATHVRSISVSETADMPPPSERLLRTIIDSLPVQIFTATPGSGELTWVNSKFLVYRGQDSRQVLKDPWQAIHPEDRAAYMEQWNKSLRTGQQLQQKVRLQRFDGNYRWFYARAAPLKDKRQNIVHWIGTNMDFHEQHTAEINSAKQQETAASEAKYRALANSSPQVVFTVNRSKGVTFCNSQWVNYSGQSEAQALGLGFMEHVHADDIVKCRLPTFDEGSLTANNVPTTLPPEPRRTLSSSQASSSGSSETERGPTSPLNSSPAQPLPQARLSELASTGILKVSRDADGKPSYSTEVRLRTKDGEFRWHLVRVLLADDAVRVDGEEDTWYGTCTDINDHKALERDLKETMDEKSRFLSNMSHEIRTPLNGITGMVNFLIDSSLTSEQMEHVNIIRASTEGLRGLINDILDLSKAEAGMIQLNMDWMHIRSLIEEVNDLTSAMAIDKGLELNYLVEANVPSQMKGDRFRLRQILLNIIGNAIKFTQEGEVFIRCRVLPTGEAWAESSVSQNEMLIQFEIIDTGRGFTEKEAQYLFKRFSQIDGSSTRQHGGTGLGLVISRQLAQLHGGDMTAKGVPGKGSSFIFFIKTSLPSESDKPPPAPPATPGPSTLASMPTVLQTAANTSSMPIRGKAPSPQISTELSQSPSLYASSPDTGKGSPTVSSASSDPSIRTTRTTSLRSERSSASSYMPDPSLMPTSPIKLTLPTDSRSRADSDSSKQSDSDTPQQSVQPPTAIRMISPGGSLLPPMFSILVVCPLEYSRQATVSHMDMTLPKSVPHQITARASLMECQKMIGGEDPVIFSHVVLVLQSVPEIVAFMDQIYGNQVHSATQLIVISDLSQKRSIVEQAPKFDYDKLTEERKLRFIFKPLKPSKFAVIFDPQKEREMSTDRNQDSAQQVAITQKQVYEGLKARLGNKGMRVLLVEDNRVNQMVLLKFLSKVSIQVDTVMDGVQCTEKVYANPHDYYSIILCDLHMPNKDGYQTCREIRKWEKKNKFPYIPIIALSANVLGDVYAKCADAGFNSYVTKPVDFKELSNVMITFMDPKDPNRPIEFMKPKKIHKS